MATLVHTTKPVEQPTWDIQRDAFAPPPTRRTVRGWDRAPVSARAPRLQGQKVWKKVGLKACNIQETKDGAQDELEKEGAGARKKSRMLTTRENINDAMWEEAAPVGYALDIGSATNSNGEQVENTNNLAASAIYNTTAELEGVLNFKKGTETPAERDQTMACSQFVPRKRTNTDHIITPKKPLHQTTFENNMQAFRGSDFVTKPSSKTLRPRKSLRKSISESMSDNTINKRISRAQSRLSSNTEHVSNIENVASVSKATLNEVGSSTSKKRALRRSTISKSSASCIEESPLANRQDPTALGASVSIQLNPSEGSIQCNTLDEIPMIGNPKLCNFTCLDGNERPQPANESMQSSNNIFATTTDAQIPDALNITSPESNSNTGSDCNYSQKLSPDKDVIASDVSESQSSSAKSTVVAKIEACQTMSSPKAVVATNDDGSLTRLVTVTLSAHTNGVDSSETEDKASRTESDASPNPNLELDIHSNIKKTDTPDDPKTNSTTTVYDHDDTDMLRNFLTRVKANKAANNLPKRKRSLPHSPLRIPLGDMDNNASPSPLQLQKGDEFNVAELSPSKRKKKSSPLAQCENEPEPRRSGRTKPPVKEPPGAPSFIPVRRLGQDIDTTVTLKRNEEKELAALTRVNTRKNKGNALTALEVLAKKSDEKEDPVMRQRLLKEVFDEKMEKGRQDKEKKGREKKSVTWAEELARFQSMVKGKGGEAADDNEKEKCVVLPSASEDKKLGAVRVGVRSKAALGVALNGTPAPKRKMRGRV